ncbi:hypothetical protein ATN84_07485 [Paramesorhizobium deserti]|uniref:Uncharacterized protein n=1 Tax=Paramesorhizobium deserti TaxID=1494590 RepID=A0A135HVQ9_9HYPH|nr:hypothetical protein ATN84_07485 [Paramesorhizobium deserti]
MVEEFLDRRRLTACCPFGTRISAAPDFGQPVLGNSACLFDGDLAVATDCRFTALTVVSDIGDHESFSADRRDLHEKAGYERIA